MDEVVVRIVDFGPELEGEAMDPTKWFEPGFSYGKDQNRNMGFGLASAWKTVARHGGRIWAERDHSQGQTTVSFTLSAVRAELEKISTMETAGNLLSSR